MHEISDLDHEEFLDLLDDYAEEYFKYKGVVKLKDGKWAVFARLEQTDRSPFYRDTRQ